MADEWVLVFETELPIPMICSDSTGIERGTLLKMSDPYTVAAAAALNDIVGGVLAEEKVASDGKAKVPVYRGGIFKAKISGSVTVGDSLVVSGAVANNLVQTAAINAEQIVAIALETGTNAETILVQLKPMTMQLA